MRIDVVDCFCDFALESVRALVLGSGVLNAEAGAILDKTVARQIGGDPTLCDRPLRQFPGSGKRECFQALD